MTDVDASPQRMNALEEAQKRMEQESAKADKTSGDGRAESGKPPKKELEIEDPKPVEKPEFLSDAGFFEVGIMVDGLKPRADGRPHIVVTDCGESYIAALQGFQKGDPARHARGCISIARSIVEWSLPAVRDVAYLGVKRREELPLPSSLLSEHEADVAEWKGRQKSWMAEVNRIDNEYESRLTLAKGTPAEDLEVGKLAREAYPDEPQHPQTKLMRLLDEEVPHLVMVRIAQGIDWCLLHLWDEVNNKPREGADSGN